MFPDKYKRKDRLYGLEQRLGEGRIAYFFLLVPEAKEKRFLAALNPKGEAFDLKDYGKILYSGYGEPPEELLEQLTTEYDVEFVE